MRYDAELADAIHRLRAADSALRQLLITVTEDRPDRGHDNLLVTRFEELCLDAKGWLQEAQAALVPVTPGPGAPPESAVAAALLDCQAAFDRCRDVVVRDITRGDALADLVVAARSRGPGWLTWIRVARGNADAVASTLDVSRDALSRCWRLLVQHLTGSPEPSQDERSVGAKALRTKGTR